MDKEKRAIWYHLAMGEVYAFKSYNSQYVCVLVNYLDKKIIDVLPSRHKDTLMNYFMLIPLEEREKVKLCSFDLWALCKDLHNGPPTELLRNMFFLM